MKCKKVYFLVFTACLTLVKCKLKVSKEPPPSMLPLVNPSRFPPDFRLRDLPSLRVPNQRFCDEQALDPAQHYVVLPWWYYHCLNIRERRERKNERQGIIPNLDLYKEVLMQVNQAKKAMRQK